MTDALAADRQAIREVIENWVLWRDAGNWERFATVWHDDGWMTATWFQGPAREFIRVSKQDATTADMIFPVATIIEWLSKGLTLEAGDVIATGTPAGVGMGRDPKEFLQNGDVVETEIEGIGTLRNRVAG